MTASWPAARDTGCDGLAFMVSIARGQVPAHSLRRRIRGPAHNGGRRFRVPQPVQKRMSRTLMHGERAGTRSAGQACNVPLHVTDGALAMADTGSRKRVRTHRARLRAQGLRPVQIWVPDVTAEGFAAEAHR